MSDKDFELGTLKREKTTCDSKLKLCEAAREDLVDDLKEKAEQIEESATAMEATRKELKTTKDELKKSDDELSTANSKLQSAKDQVDEMVSKFAQMKTEYTKALEREETLRTERNKLKENLTNADETNEENMQLIKDLRDDLQAKADGKNLKPKDDEHFYEKKLFKDKDIVDPPKRDILDQKVEEAFAQRARGSNEDAVAPPPVLPNNDTLIAQNNQVVDSVLKTNLTKDSKVDDDDWVPQVEMPLDSKAKGNGSMIVEDYEENEEEDIEDDGIEENGMEQFGLEDDIEEEDKDEKGLEDLDEEMNIEDEEPDFDNNEFEDDDEAN